MTTRQRAQAARLFPVLVIGLLMCASPGVAQPASSTLVGRRLDDALRVLQAQGLRLVFSSELVTPEMRVRTEPRAKAPRERLGELLRPHGLVAENGPAGLLQIVRAKRSPPERPHVTPPPASPDTPDPRRLEAPPSAATYRERVTVTARANERDQISAGIDRQLAFDELAGLGGHIADDPLRVVQALPGVATGDDFRSEYSVRGSEYRQAGVIIDGVVAPWLQHAALGRGDTGTLTMLRGDVVQEAELQVGAYPRVDSSQLGPQLSLTLRDGSRTRRRVRLGVSGISTTATAEGPLGSPARGSWLVGMRKSHNEWPLGRDDEHSAVFGFSDVQSKLNYDVRPGQQVSLTVVAGVSNIEREDPNPFAPADGLNRAALVALAWRSVIGAHTVVTQRASWLAHDFSNRNQTPQGASRGANGADAYRVDLSRPLLRGVIDAGGHVRRVRGSRHGTARLTGRGESPGAAADEVESSWLERAGYASFSRAIGTAVTVAAGLRLSNSTLVHRGAVDRWLQTEWSITPRWHVHGSTGVMHQFPALEAIAGRAEPTSLRPERAAYVNLGVGHRISTSVRWDATVFVRRERDALRGPDLHPRVIDGVLAVDGTATHFDNALSGSTRGIELTLARRSPTGVSGWIGYSYGVARHTDAVRGETFASDFNQRHVLNATALAALPWHARLGLTFRGGTNVPIPGYFLRRDAGLYAGTERNSARLPVYARLDIRAERTFDRGGHRFTLYAETINLLNRGNLGVADGTILRDTGEAVGFTEPLLPRLLTAGLRFEF